MTLYDLKKPLRELNIWQTFYRPSRILECNFNPKAFIRNHFKPKLEKLSFHSYKSPRTEKVWSQVLWGSKAPLFPPCASIGWIFNLNFNTNRHWKCASRTHETNCDSRPITWPLHCSYINLSNMLWYIWFVTHAVSWTFGPKKYGSKKTEPPLYLKYLTLKITHNTFYFIVFEISTRNLFTKPQKSKFRLMPVPNFLGFNLVSSVHINKRWRGYRMQEIPTVGISPLAIALSKSGMLLYTILSVYFLSGFVPLSAAHSEFLLCWRKFLLFLDNTSHSRPLEWNHLMFFNIMSESESVICETIFTIFC